MQINFKNWLYENTSAASIWLSNSQSWLDPKGTFHPIQRLLPSGRYGSHSDWAISQGKKSSDLFDSNWMRIISIGHALYASNDSGKVLTLPQKTALKNLMYDSNGRFKSVVWENGQGFERTIATLEDL